MAIPSLSLALLVLGTTPAFAQIRRSAPLPSGPAKIVPAPGQANTTPDFSEVNDMEADARLSPVPSPSTEFRIFVGPAFESGRHRDFKSRDSQTVTGPTNLPTGASFTSSSSSSATVDQVGTGTGFGVMYGLEGKWWPSRRMGLGGSLFGAFVGSGTSASVLQPESLPSNRVEGGNTVTVSDATTITPPFGTTYTATLTPVPVGGGPGSVSYRGWRTIPGQGGDNFTLRSGSDTGANPDSYESSGGVTFATAQSTWLNEPSVCGSYRFVDGPWGEVSFFGGVTVPVAQISQTFTARTVGAKEQGAVAVETRKVDQGGGQTYTERTEYELNESRRLDSSLVAAGPIVGLDARARLGQTGSLYTRVGYAPILVGALSASTNVTVKNRRTVTTSDIQGNPAGITAGARTHEVETTSPTRTVAAISSSEMMGAVGATFNVGGLNLFTEALARVYTPTFGPQLIYGANLGVDLRF